MKPSPLRLLTLAIAGAIFLCAVVALLSRPAPSAAGPAVTPTPRRILLPLVRFDPTPTPVATPTRTPSSAAAVVYITPNTSINASTFNRSAIIVANQSSGGERLTELRIDLSTAIFPDMVFDPTGAAGDTVFKDVQMNFKSDGLSYTRVFEAPHDGGYDVLVLRFGGFDGGDRFEFSVDVDPTSITGVSAPGPAESGSVGGLELVGATLTAVFDNGATYANQIYRMPDGGAAGPAHSGAWALLRAGVPARPQVSVLGVAAPAVVTASSQTVRVTGPAGRPAVVLVVEGGLFLGGVPGGGFDVDPFEANSAVTVREYPAVIGPDGFIDVAIDLTRTTPESGIHAIAAVLDDHYGLKGLVAGPVVIELAD